MSQAKRKFLARDPAKFERFFDNGNSFKFPPIAEERIPYHGYMDTIPDESPYEFSVPEARNAHRLGSGSIPRSRTRSKQGSDVYSSGWMESITADNRSRSVPASRLSTRQQFELLDRLREEELRSRSLSCWRETPAVRTGPRLLTDSSEVVDFRGQRLAAARTTSMEDILRSREYVREANTVLKQLTNELADAQNRSPTTNAPCNDNEFVYCFKPERFERGQVVPAEIQKVKKLPTSASKEPLGRRSVNEQSCREHDARVAMRKVEASQKRLVKLLQAEYPNGLLLSTEITPEAATEIYGCTAERRQTLQSIAKETEARRRRLLSDRCSSRAALDALQQYDAADDFARSQTALGVPRRMDSLAHTAFRRKKRPATCKAAGVNFDFSSMAENTIDPERECPKNPTLVSSVRYDILSGKKGPNYRFAAPETG